jgi:hypothetical protein
MDIILWILIVVAVLIALGGLFAFARTRQRRGGIYASQSAGKSGGAQ